VPPSGQTLVGAASDPAPRSPGYRSGVEHEGELEWAESFCAANGYGPPKVFGDGRWAAVHRRMFNATLIVAEIGEETTYLDHWCYESTLAAAAALTVWDGTGEPVGWFRHAATGRRVSRSADERDGQLRRVGAVGVSYILVGRHLR
jgi:hypothetical protein